MVSKHVVGWFFLVLIVDNKLQKLKSCVEIEFGDVKMSNDYNILLE